MAGNAVGADNTFVFELGQVIHPLAQLFGPPGGTNIVQQHQVEVVGADLLEKARDDDIGCGPLGFRKGSGVEPNLSDDCVLVPGDSLQGGQDVRMRAVEIREVEQTDAALRSEEHTSELQSL